jgi:hypothetical protein
VFAQEPVLGSRLCSNGMKAEPKLAITGVVVSVVDVAIVNV